jgi:hypothetical protein
MRIFEQISYSMYILVIFAKPYNAKELTLYIHNVLVASTLPSQSSEKLMKIRPLQAMLQK